MRAYTGAGWLVPLCGDIMQMPGLGKSPAALNVDIDADGQTVGLLLGRQPLQRPAPARRGAVDEAIVQPVVAVLPELEALRR